MVLQSIHNLLESLKQRYEDRGREAGSSMQVMPRCISWHWSVSTEAGVHKALAASFFSIDMSRSGVWYIAIIGSP
jgi:hypothetical protein